MESSLIAGRSGRDPDAVAAREAEVSGKPCRVAPIAVQDVGEQAWTIVNAIRSALSLPPTDDMAVYGLVMVQHPEMFRCQMEMGTALFLGKLPPRERELAVLRVGWLLGAPYEWGEHVGLGKRCGLTEEEVERVTEGSAAPGWSEHDAAILSAVEQMLSRQTVSDETWAVLARRWDVQQQLEFPMMVGQYVCTAIVQNTLRVPLEKGNRGLTSR